MSITTHTELKTAVKNWLNRGTELDSYLDDLVLFGEKRIYRKLRVRAMETALSVTISSGVAAIPSDYVELKYAYLSTTPVTKLNMKEAGWIIEAYPTRSADGLPKFFAQDGSNFIFGPYPDSGYTLSGTYYKRLDPLASTTNAIFTTHPDLYLFAALAESAIFLKASDQRLAVWEARFNDVLGQVQGEYNKGRLSGGALQMVPA